MTMTLIVGGYAAGKRAYAREVLGYRDGQMSRDPASDAPVLYGLEDLAGAGEGGA